MSVIYKAVKSKDADGRICYGVGLIKTYTDVFASEADAQTFAQMCNKHNLSDIHFDDAIDDYLNK